MGPLERCVGDVEAFAAQYWGQVPLHRSSRGGGFCDLLTVEDIDSMLASAARRPTIRLVNGGVNVPARDYCAPIRLGATQVNDVADARLVSDAFAGGASIVMQSLHRTWGPLIDFTVDLEDQLSHPVQANAYLTPPQSRGLAPHSDGHDVLVLQCSGTKQWEVAGLGRVDMLPGDVLYLPRGTEHHAVTGAAASLHITLGLMAITYRSVLRRLLDEGADELDRSLPVGYLAPGSELPDGIDNMLRAARSALDTVDPLAVAEKEHRRRQPRRRRNGHLLSVVAATEVTPDSVIRSRDGVRLDVVCDPDSTQVLLTYDGRTLRLPAVAHDALDDLLTRDHVRVGDLVGLDEPSRLVLARRLLSEGFVTIEREHAHDVAPGGRR